MPENVPKSSSDDEQVLSTRLFIVVCLVVTFIATLLIFGLFVQWNAYAEGIRAAQVTTARLGITDHAAIITYARGLGAAVNKTSALFLGFILVFTGALYVLRSASTTYSFSTEGKIAGKLEATSPGLIIVTLGVVLVVATMMINSDLHYHGSATVDPANSQEPPQGTGQSAEPGKK